MARRANTILICTGMISLGLAIGGHLQNVSWTKTANAVPVSGNYAAPSTATPWTAIGDHISDISTRVMPAAVHIQATRRENDGRRVEETGSGVFVRSTNVKGLFIVTNNHVIRGAELSAIELRTFDGKTINPIRVYRDEETDLAVMQVRDMNVTTGEWGNSDHVLRGNFVLAVGSPFGLSQSVTMGIVSAKGRRDLTLTDDRSVTNQDFIQTDAAINPGNSGGPLIDMQGNVIGINTAIASNSGGNEGIGFSIPCNLARHVFEELVQHGRVRRAYLGVELDDDFTTTTARLLGLDHPSGARVIRVYKGPGYPAAAAGIRMDDVIVSFNNVPVSDENHLITLVSLADIGRPAAIEVYRKGRRHQLSLKLMERESVQSASRKPGHSFLFRD